MKEGRKEGILALKRRGEMGGGGRREAGGGGSGGLLAGAGEEGGLEVGGFGVAGGVHVEFIVLVVFGCV